MGNQMEFETVIEFWKNAGEKKWFSKSSEFDSEFRTKFLDAHLAAAARKLDDWAGDPQGALALVVLLDQFPRNCFRDTAHMFATDPLARLFAKRAIDAGFDARVEKTIRLFFYMPLMHSEDLADQDRSVALFEKLGPDLVKYAVTHRDIVARFGRFPHRNASLARDATPEEKAFLDAGGFAG